ncbi:RNA polymerase sigma-70 factor, ECF subfamily [Actinacidiphila guanduensis]|uniref:RNA polymerase sigma-70 factor, ECF subfamily n=2 Tax=Actinacidiphila guanduensis TaxID=310781 RepID=A0A1G9Z8C6_9ACTN|nr:RNA polymerase sigma-70 factor, ECF subfamily [Actinacidiphila guanduensis]
MRAHRPPQLTGEYEEGVVGKAELRRHRRMDEAELSEAVALAQHGDHTAFGRVYRDVHPMLLGYLRGLVGDDADDIASETWHDIVRDLGRFHGDGISFRSWAATIARHRALDHMRRTKVRPRTTELDEGVAERTTGPDSEGLALDNLSTERALALIAELPQDQAEAVLLRVVLGLNGPMAAEVLGKRPGAVRTAAHRGLKRLSERLRGAEEK